MTPLIVEAHDRINHKDYAAIYAFIKNGYANLLKQEDFNDLKKLIIKI